MVNHKAVSFDLSIRIDHAYKLILQQICQTAGDAESRCITTSSSGGYMNRYDAEKGGKRSKIHVSAGRPL